MLQTLLRQVAQQVQDIEGRILPTSLKLSSMSTAAGRPGTSLYKRYGIDTASSSTATANDPVAFSRASGMARTTSTASACKAAGNAAVRSDTQRLYAVDPAQCPERDLCRLDAARVRSDHE
jgi:hypothetical protein